MTRPRARPALQTGPAPGRLQGPAPRLAVDPALAAAIIDLSADAIITIAPDETILSWNHGAQAMFGWAPAEVIGQHFAILLPHEELERGELEWIRATTEAEGSIRDYETRRRRKDGSVFDVSLTRTAVVDEAGRLIGFSAVLRDITYRKRLERQLLASERLATAGQVAAGVAHEIGAPLTAITMMVDHLLKSRCLECAGGDQVSLLRSQTDRIAKLARDLVQIAKPAGVARAPLDPREPVATACALVKSQLEGNGIAFSITAAPDVPVIQGDGSQLQQVVLNLLFNAQRAMAGRGGKIAVDTRLASDRTSAEIVVSDNGPGIAEEDRPHVFTPFFSRTGGSGLGLAISEQIVTAHKGTIEVRSRPGQGATFTIRLPAGTTDD